MVRAALTLLMLMSIAGCNERHDVHYADWAEAQANGAVERGWMPAFVPRSATDLRERHDLDSNAQTLSFVVKPQEVEAMTARLPLLSGASKDAVLREMGLGDLWSRVHAVCSPERPGALVVTAAGDALYRTALSSAKAACADLRASTPSSPAHPIR